MGDDTACFPGCACLRCVGVVKPGTQVAVPNQAVHLGADGVCIHGQSETCAEGFRRLGLDRKTPWMAPPAAEIPVTDEMRRAGSVASGFAPDHVHAGPMAVAIYRAMDAHRPVPLVSEAEDRIAALMKERDADKRLIECDTAAIVAQAGENIRLRALLATKDAEIALLRQALAMKDARIGELKSVLASTPVAFEDPDAKPEPEINPFRNFGHDPRRMGPL